MRARGMGLPLVRASQCLSEARQRSGDLTSNISEMAIAICETLILIQRMDICPR